MLPETSRAGRNEVVRLFTLAVLAAASLACGIPLNAAEMTATAVLGGNVMTPVVVTNPTLASSLLADLPQLAGSASATTTPAPNASPGATATPVTTPTPAASTTPSPSTTTPTTTTPAAGTPRPGTPAAGSTASVTPRATGTVVIVQAATAAGPNAEMGTQTLTLLNTYRAQAGVPPLRANAALAAAANNYARLLAERNAFGHDGPDGSSPSSRIAASGYAGRFKGEALAAGQTSPQSAINTWLNSPGHRDILLDRGAVDVGIGYYSKPGTTYTTYWVLVTGVQ